MEILIAEDDVTSRMVLESALRKRGYQVTAVGDGEMALGVLGRPQPPRIALLDWLMPGPSGVEICQQLRQMRNNEDSYIYTILVSGKRSIDEIIEGLAAGADDYVTKPFNADELELRIRAGKRIIDLQDALVAAKTQLRIQADHDALTGVLNRRALLERFRSELARADREANVAGVAMMDLDHFKNINDTYGHQAGDEVLREVVRRVQRGMRPYDFLGRYGGEEFLLITPGVRPGETQPFERARQSICDNPMVAAGASIPVTLSIGAAWGKGPGNLEDLIRQADTLLYAAKSKGRNRVESVLDES